MICQPSDVILIPFPFTDLSVAKKRPVLVITPENNQGDFIGLQITSKQGYKKTLEINSEDFILGSLPKTSFIRTDKIFTLNRSIILYKVGQLADAAFSRVEEKMCKLLCKKYT
jgi:mRNA interferase MazF